MSKYLNKQFLRHHTRNIVSAIHNNDLDYTELEELRDTEMKGSQRVRILDAIEKKLGSKREQYLEELRAERDRLTQLLLDVQEKIQEVSNDT